MSTKPLDIFDKAAFIIAAQGFSYELDKTGQLQLIVNGVTYVKHLVPGAETSIGLGRLAIATLGILFTNHDSAEQYCFKAQAVRATLELSQLNTALVALDLFSSIVGNWGD